MIRKNAELHNICELTQKEGLTGLSTRRVPKEVEEHLSEGGRRMNYSACGAEIRFVINSGEAKVTLITGDDESKLDCKRVPVFYGCFGAGWQDCLKNVYNTPTEIVIPKHPKLDILEKIAKEEGHPFSPKVVRISLQNARFRLIDIEGDITPPTPDLLPKKKFLAYGSSITHGSLGLLQCNTWTARVAEKTGAELYNLGYAGSAHLEREMADHIAQNCDFDFATLEMGINILGIDPEDFRSRVRYFVSTVASAHPNAKIFCIDIFRCEDDFRGGGKAARFREIVGEVLEELSLPNTVHVDGMQMLPRYGLLSGDLVHPNLRGCEVMAENIAGVILENM